MVDPRPDGARTPASAGSSRDTSGQPGGIGIGLAAVLTFALAQGSWEWFSAYIGVTLLAVIFPFYRLPTWMPGLRSAYMWNLATYSLVVGLCVAIALAPAMQRWSWLFPMSVARGGCPELGASTRRSARRPRWRTWLAATVPPWPTRGTLKATPPSPAAWQPRRPSGCRYTGAGRP